jgi:hypothetical protein
MSRGIDDPRVYMISSYDPNIGANYATDIGYYNPEAGFAAPVAGIIAPPVAGIIAPAVAPGGTYGATKPGGAIVGTNASGTLGEFIVLNGNTHQIKTLHIINNILSIKADKIVAAGLVIFGNGNSLNNEVKPEYDAYLGNTQPNSTIIQEALQDLATSCIKGKYNLAFLDEADQPRFIITDNNNFWTTYLDNTNRIILKKFDERGDGQPMSQTDLDAAQLFATSGFSTMARKTNKSYLPGISISESPYKFLPFQRLNDKGKVVDQSFPELIPLTSVQLDLPFQNSGIKLLAFARTDR